LKGGQAVVVVVMGILDAWSLLLICCRLSYDCAGVSLGFPLLVNATLVEIDGGSFPGGLMQFLKLPRTLWE